MLDSIFVYDDGDHIVAVYTNAKGDVVWTEAHETIEEARIAYAAQAAVGLYEESAFI